MKRFFITGIGTDVGKTVVAAILTEALEADYWKPIQAGDLDFTDTMKVKALISNSASKFHPETYRLTKPMSPHAAAEQDNIEIALDDFKLPETANNLIVEGAGGLMVPINWKDLIADLIQSLSLEVIIVSQHYLGSINHTLLTIDVLQSRGISIKGIIFNGASHPATEKVILAQTGVPCLGRIAQHEVITQEVVHSYKAKFESI